MSTKEVIGYIISVILLFFAVIFLLASSYDPLTLVVRAFRLIASAFLFIAGFAALYYLRKQKPTQIIQKLELPGQIRVQPIRCPNCGASLDINQTKIIDGVPSIKCSYCGHTFEVTEEPKW